MGIVLFLAGSLTLFGAAALLTAPALLRPSREARRLLSVVESNRPDLRTIGRMERLENRVLALAARFRAWLRLSENAQLSQRLISAGFKNNAALVLYSVFRFLSPLLGVVGGSFMSENRAFWMMSFALVGYLLPDFWLGRKIKQHRERIRRGIPDAVDLMVICVDAGLGLDQALLRVGQELEMSHPEIHDELLLINLEQRAGKPRLEAWKSMAERTQLEEFTGFVNMLAQTDRFGTPIVRALSRFAEEIRLKRRQRAEEMAAKTKIKILFPLVLFIFPCIFIVLLAPAILSIGAGLKTMGQ